MDSPVITELRSDDDQISRTYVMDGISMKARNLLRQALMADVACLGTGEVEFQLYDGPIEATVVALRCGQLPIRLIGQADSTPPAGTTATFRVDVTATAPRQWVMSTDFVCTSGNAEIVHHRSDRERKAARFDKGYHVFPLRQGQVARLVLRVRVSTGREHTRWQCIFPRIKHCGPSSCEVTVTTRGSVSPRNAFVQAVAIISKRLHDAVDDTEV